MKAALAVLLLPLLAFGQEAQPLETIPSDVPIIATVKSGTAVVAYSGGEQQVNLVPGSFINDVGMGKLNKTFQTLQLNLIEAKAQNEALRTRVDEIAADPPLNLKTVLIIAGCSLAVGAAAGAGIYYGISTAKGK